MDTLGRILTAPNLSALLLGLGAGAALAWLAQRRRPRPLPWWAVAGAVVVAMAATGRLEGAAPYTALDLAAGAIGAWTAAGAGLLHRRSSARWLAPGAVAIGLVGVWAAVPENSQVVVVLGILLGAAMLSSVARGAALSPGAVAVLGASVAWTAAIGSPVNDVRYLGALLCVGLLLWWPLLGPFVTRPARGGILAAGAVHILTVLLASRWVGVAADATWARGAVVALIGAGASLALRSVATRVAR